MKFLFQLLVFILLFGLNAKAQQQFQLLYHPFPSQQAACMKLAVGGGYLLASNYTDAAGEQGILITKFDANFSIAWEKTVNQTGIVERASSFSQQSNGDIFLVASADTNIMIMKMDSSANIIWQNIYHYSYPSTAIEVIEAATGSLYVLGNYIDNIGVSVQLAMVMKLNSTGIIQWIKGIPYSNHYCWGINEFYTGNMLTIAYVNTTLNTIDGNLIQLDTSGNVIWQQMYGLTASASFQAGNLYNALSSPDGGHVLFGWKAAPFDPFLFIMKTDSVGNTTQLIDYDATQIVDFSRGIATADGGYAVSGVCGKPWLSAGKIGLLKVDSNLNPQWSRNYNEVANLHLWYPVLLLQTPDNGFLLTTTTDSLKVLLLKTDSIGYTSCNDSDFTEGTMLDSIYPFSFLPALQSPAFSPFNYSPIVSSLGPGNYTDTLCIQFTAVNEVATESITISPNPASSQFTISSWQNPIKEIEIFNLMGEKIYSASANSEEFTVNCQLFPQGIYKIKVFTERGHYFSSTVLLIK